MPFRSTKTYGHDVGLSACFRQWRADSHCNKLHGYALAFTFVFEAEELDARNWVVDFGSLKSFKGRLEDYFDHKLCVAADDPLLDQFDLMQIQGLCNLRVYPNVGCEAFAHFAYALADLWLIDNGYTPRVRVVSVECREHGANSAIYIGADT